MEPSESSSDNGPAANRLAGLLGGKKRKTKWRSKVPTSSVSIPRSFYNFFIRVSYVLFPDGNGSFKKVVHETLTV